MHSSGIPASGVPSNWNGPDRSYLKEFQVAVLTFAIDEGLSDREIASRLGRPVSSVHQARSNGLHALRRLNDPSTRASWLAIYGLTRSRRPVYAYDTKIKSQVLVAVAGGQMTPTEIAAVFKVGRSSVIGWAHAAGLSFPARQKSRPAQETFVFRQPKKPKRRKYDPERWAAKALAEQQERLAGEVLRMTRELSSRLEKRAYAD